jgi:hypothetical protein
MDSYGIRAAASRQHRWQLDRLASGLCSLCGRRPLRHYARSCDPCALAQRRRRQARLGLTPWHPGGPGRPPIWSDELLHVRGRQTEQRRRIIRLRRAAPGFAIRDPSLGGSRRRIIPSTSRPRARAVDGSEEIPP